jgi:hypothetical protein
MKIPVYDQQLVPNQSMGNTRIVADQTGSGMAQIGEGLQNLAVALNSREKVKAQAWFTQASSQADLDLNKMLNEQTKTAQPGAEGFGKTYLEAFDKYKSQAVANAPAHAKSLMEAHLSRTREAYGLQAMKFENDETYRHMGQQFETGLDASVKMVAMTPEKLYDDLGKFVLSAETMAATPEQKTALKELARQKLASSAVMGSIDRNPSGNLEEAPGYSMLTSEEQAKVEAYAKQKKNEFKTQKMASAFIDTSKHVISNMPVLPGDVINVTEAKKQAVNVFKKSGMTLDGEQQLQLESYVEQVAADREREIKRGREVTMATAFAKLDKNGGDYQALLAENPWLANQPTEMKTRLNEYAGTVATGGTKATDWTAYNSLIDTPALLKEANIDAMRDKFNSREYNHLLKLKQELNQPGAEQNLVDNGPMVKQMLKDAGFESEEAQGKFRSLLQTAINQELEITQKKKLPQTRIKELAADLLVEEVTKKRSLWWDATAAGFEVEIPEAERARIESALQASGMPVNDYNVNQAYRSILRKQNGQ